MSMTGHDPRDSAPYLNTKVGIGGGNATRDCLIEWMDLIGRKDTPIRPLDFFVTLLTRVDEGRIKPIKRVCVIGQYDRLDPFCTIIAEADAVEAFDEMRNPSKPDASGIPAHGTGPTSLPTNNSNEFDAGYRESWMKDFATQFLKKRHGLIPIREAVTACRATFPGCSDKDARAIYRTLPKGLRRVRESKSGLPNENTRKRPKK